MIPEVAQHKLALLSQQAEDAMALAQAAKRKLADAETRLVNIRNAKGDERAVAQASEQVERAGVLMRERYETWQRQEQQVTQVRAWLDQQRNVTLEAVPAPSITLDGSPAHIAGILRSQIAALANEYRAITVAGPTPADARAQIRSMVETLAARGAPRMHVQLGSVRLVGWDRAESIGPAPFTASLEFQCWLDPERVINRLNEMLEQMPSNTDALPVAERAARLAEIEEEVFILECREEATIQRAAQDGIILPRRDGASPSAILGVRVVQARARAAA